MDERSVARGTPGRVGDPLARTGEKLEIHRRTHQDLLAAVREEQERTGRGMTGSELDRFTREFHAPEYRQDVRRILALTICDDAQDEE